MKTKYQMSFSGIRALQISRETEKSYWVSHNKDMWGKIESRRAKSHSNPLFDTFEEAKQQAIIDKTKRIEYAENHLATAINDLKTIKNLSEKDIIKAIAL